MSAGSSAGTASRAVGVVPECPVEGGPADTEVFWRSRSRTAAGLPGPDHREDLLIDSGGAAAAAVLSLRGAQAV